MKKLPYIALVLIYFSCQKEEFPVSKKHRGDKTSASVSMGTDYQDQIWYSLSENRIVAQNKKTDWDLAFSSSLGFCGIKVNTAKSMRAFVTQHTELNEVTDTIGMYLATSDVSSGNLDSLAIGNWKQHQKVIWLDLGYTASNQRAGFVKLKVLSEQNQQYHIQYQFWGELQIHYQSVLTDPETNFSYISLINHTQLEIEPQKSVYDLCFTSYTHIFKDPLIYYQVSGVLLNPYQTKAVHLLNKSFDEVSISDTIALVFIKLDAIGYDWKFFNLNTNQYLVDSEKCYLIRNSKGFWYKLRFIDFYSETGEKGHPEI